MAGERPAGGSERQVTERVYDPAGDCTAICREGRLTKSILVSLSAIFPALPGAFSCSGALTHSTVDKEADLAPVVLNRLGANCRGCVAFARSSMQVPLMGWMAPASGIAMCPIGCRMKRSNKGSHPWMKLA